MVDTLDTVISTRAVVSQYLSTSLFCGFFFLLFVDHKLVTYSFFKERLVNVRFFYLSSNIFASVLLYIGRAIVALKLLYIVCSRFYILNG